MATIILRQTKGSPLTIAEVDLNFTNLNNAILNLEATGGGGGGGGGLAWSPVFAGIEDGDNVYLKIVDWVGGTGEGTKPAVDLYVTATGYSANVAEAINFKGPPGPQAAGVKDVISVSTSYTISQNDNGNVLDVIAASTITIPTGLDNFYCDILPPATGVVTITPASGVTINGVTTSLTRSAANTAVAIIPTSVANVYKVTGI